MSTPHNAAEPGQIADIVLMPGDPARATMIAKTYLENYETVNTVRGNFCYTGFYKGKRISVMSSGMGMPSIGIYAYELFSKYDVKAIIRIGTAGGYVKELNVNDVFIADSAFSETSFAKVMTGYDKDITYSSPELSEKLQAAAMAKGIVPMHGTMHSSDVFYRMGGLGYVQDVVKNHDCKCVEMESFALFHIASVLGKQAAAICTISDSFVYTGELTAEERQNSLHKMIQIALDSCLL